MREIAHNWISPVRIKVNASQIAVATAGAAQSEDRSAKQKTTFFDSIIQSLMQSSAFLTCHFGGKRILRLGISLHRFGVLLILLGR